MFSPFFDFLSYRQPSSGTQPSAPKIMAAELSLKDLTLTGVLDIEGDGGCQIFRTQLFRLPGIFQRAFRGGIYYTIKHRDLTIHIFQRNYMAKGTLLLERGYKGVFDILPEEKQSELIARKADFVKAAEIYL